MSQKTFVLIPGAGGDASYWHRVVPQLESPHCEALAVDLPADDDKAGLDDYADVVVDAIGSRTNVVLVAQSLGGFTAPLVCARSRSVRALVLVNAMIPLPGETAGDWWEHTGAVAARIAAAGRGGYPAAFDVTTYFLHDVPRDVLRDASSPRRQSDAVFAAPCRFAAWPPMPIRVVAGADDRFFPVEFQRQVARSRLGADVDVIPGGHLVALSNPAALGDYLQAVGRG